MKDRLERKIIEIEKIIKLKYKDEKGIGLLMGLSGMALFEFYYSKYFNSEENAEIGSDIIIECVNKINNGYSSSTFAHGISGFGWALDHLEQENFITIDNDKLLTECDQLLYNGMISFLKEGDYDLLNGGLGYAYYFLNRFRTTKSNKLKDKYKIYLFEFIKIIEDLAEEDGENKLKWVSVLNRENNEIGYNLCLSHGMASLIGMFTKLYEYEVFKPRVEKMLIKSINYILDLRNDEKIASCFFPSSILLNGKINNKIRVAWCYGDLGLGIRLLHASKALRDNELNTLSITMLKHVASRTTFETNLVYDAGICHGSFGNAQIFNKVFMETGDSTFKDASAFWLNDGFDKANHQDGYAGFKQFKGDNRAWVAEHNLLFGIAGIGLTLIDQLSHSNHNWDECLMIS
ncbi:MAG: hypothetical protein COW66_13025 [Flavobacteriaceae bacterium CG18_big_fil_WC_8_21_14_2_50_34_36]|nr:hypothetical protein [Flavobacteriia bacterium]NCT18054.1 hypothetical protein [Flavobacteriia bacterium]PIQ17189.1 MAG: hypothetical protein COW66_13025 [Flavobacteriaceae bacterium CG18_big_fil_WC_8_21_14_2_50_34_36]PJC08217.1 MAG: hypothetical protein CO068_02210 [Flavobacteriaceae bacterium CG_4_9_14_0_8_um_filter_34_30]